MLEKTVYRNSAWWDNCELFYLNTTRLISMIISLIIPSRLTLCYSYLVLTKLKACSVLSKLNTILFWWPFVKPVYLHYTKICTVSNILWDLKQGYIKNNFEGARTNENIYGKTKKQHMLLNNNFWNNRLH